MTSSGIDLVALAQYLTSAGILALLAFTANIIRRLANLETLLSNPEQGLSPIVSQMRQRVADLAGEMQNMAGRLATMDDDLREAAGLRHELAALNERLNTHARELAVLNERLPRR